MTGEISRRLRAGEEKSIICAVDGRDFQRRERADLKKARNNNERKKKDAMRTRIQTFNELNGGGVLIQKVARGYSLFRQDTGRPVARLRPTGNGDQVEVMWWSHRDKWEQIGDFGPMVMSLDEALNYIAEDPMGCFWN